MSLTGFRGWGLIVDRMYVGREHGREGHPAWCALRWSVECVAANQKNILKEKVAAGNQKEGRGHEIERDFQTPRLSPTSYGADETVCVGGRAKNAPLGYTAAREPDRAVCAVAWGTGAQRRRDAATRCGIALHACYRS